MMRRLLSVTLLLLLAACEEQANSTLKQWMEQVRRDMKPQIQALPPAETFTSFQYNAADRADPFDAKKLAAGFGDGMLAGEGLQPDRQRAREPLENYPLESLKMVGSMRRSAQVMGLIEADKIIYQVRQGSHLGQNYGKVVAIADEAILIDELVQDANGSWLMRRTQIVLQEKR
jgi:type IV pilus assembly protein PilP